MLSRARHFMPLEQLKNVYYATFSSHLMYSCQVWNQKLVSVTNKISPLQNKAVRIMTFSDFNAHAEPLYKILEIPKFSDSITLQNCLFAHDFLRGLLPKAFPAGIFERIKNLHPTLTRKSATGMLYAPKFKKYYFWI